MPIFKAPPIGANRDIIVNGVKEDIYYNEEYTNSWEGFKDGNTDKYTIVNNKVVWNDGTILQYNGNDVLPSDEVVNNGQYTTRQATPSPTNPETWVLNETLQNLGNEFETTINFVSNSESFSKIAFGSMPREYLKYDDTNAYFNGTWNNQTYRTITFATAPTGELLTWLQGNGTKQSSTPTYKFKHWKKSNVVVNRTLVGEKYYYFKPYTLLGLYTITTNLTNCTGASANATKIQENGGLTLTFTANTGYELPTGVSVTNVTSYNWNKSTGVLAISKPTGDVSIEIVAVSALPQLSTPTNIAVTDTTLTFDEVANATSYEVFVDNVSIGTHTIATIPAGTYHFNNEYITFFDGTTAIDFSYKSNNVNYTKMYRGFDAENKSAIGFNNYPNDNGMVGYVFNHGWGNNSFVNGAWKSVTTNTAIQTIVVETDQHVPQEFYNWFMANTLYGNVKETWLLNSTIKFPASGYNDTGNLHYKIKFVAKNRNFVDLSFWKYVISSTKTLTNMYYNDGDDSNTGGNVTVYTNDKKWYNQGIGDVYRTIHLYETPTGDLLTWLKSNGTKQ